MDYSQYISTPKETTEAAPQVTKLQLSEGRLTGGFLYFPYGPAGGLHFLARIKNQQILPFNAGQNFHLDDCVIPFSMGIDLSEPPWIIDLVTWNDSTTYSHVLLVCFFLDPFAKPR